MEKSRKQSSRPVPVIVGVLAVGVIVVLVFLLVGRGAQEAEIQITQDQLVIAGLYGKTYALSSIEDVRIIEGTPDLERKINGADFPLRKVYRGQFEVAGIGRCRVFLSGESGPYLLLTTDSETVLIMYEDGAETEDLYNRLNTELP